LLHNVDAEVDDAGVPVYTESVSVSLRKKCDVNADAQLQTVCKLQLREELGGWCEVPA
jgi:hypothetical protein